MPINSSVEDMRSAQRDMKRVVELGGGSRKVSKILEHLASQIKVNRKREKDTYSKMFFPTKDQAAQAEQGQSVSEYVEK